MAPAGAPIGLVDLAEWAGTSLSGGDVSTRLRESVAEQFGVRFSFLTSTGRAGLTLLLRALRRLAPAGRDEVVLPSYTCYSVAASIVKAGLRPRVVDIVPETLDFAAEDLESADFSRVLVVIATNLYGLPNDLPALTRVARRRGTFVIDDAAQAMGASVGGRRCGTWGDAGLFSFDKGKNVSAIDGGVILSNSPEVAAAVEQEMQGLPSPGAAASGLGIVKALAYSALLRPSLYGIPARIPQLQLGRTIFTTDFPIERPSRPLVALAATMMGRLEEFTEARCANASRLAAALESLPGVISPHAAPDSRPVYLRFPLLMPDRATRDAAIARLHRVGIGATGSYPLAIADVPELRGKVVASPDGLAGGRFVADRIVTLPTHPYMTARDVETTTATLRALLHEPPVSRLHPATGAPAGVTE